MVFNGMPSEVESIGSKQSDFYAEYWHEESILRVLIRDERGSTLDERCKLSFEGWLELKSCESPRRTYLRHYRRKPFNYREGIFISPAAKLRTPPEVEEARRQGQHNKPMGCGMQLFLTWLVFTALVLLVSLIGNLFSR
jgi:hypothetical protein